MACGVLLLVVLELDLHALDIRAAALPASEHRTIEALMQHVAHLTEAVFMRNTTAYPATTAAQFLRSTRGATLDDITTAEDCIAQVARIFSTTGQPYRLRCPDGHEVRSGDSLRLVLQQLAQSS